MKNKLFIGPYSKLPTDNSEEDINDEIKKKIKSKKDLFDKECEKSKDK